MKESALVLSIEATHGNVAIIKCGRSRARTATSGRHGNVQLGVYIQLGKPWLSFSVQLVSAMFNATRQHKQPSRMLTVHNLFSKRAPPQSLIQKPLQVGINTVFANWIICLFFLNFDVSHHHFFDSKVCIKNGRWKPGERMWAE